MVKWVNKGENDLFSEKEITANGKCLEHKIMKLLIVLEYTYDIEYNRYQSTR
jgi:hypothetical protein